MESSLYHAAPSFETYANRETFQTRIKIFAKSVFLASLKNKLRRRYINMHSE